MYSTAAVQPARSSWASVPVSKRWPTGSSALGPHLVRAPVLEHLAAPEEEPEVRAEELVGRADEDVDARCRHVDRPVGRVVDGVDPGERAGFVREVGDPPHVRDRADGVRGPRERDDLRLLRDLRLEIAVVERAVLLAQVGVAHDEVEVVGELEPGRDVRVVVEARDDDLVACGKVAAERSREREVERRHVLAEADLRG